MVHHVASDARLQAAKQLQARLKLILEGEAPYDIFVRWKPLSEQAFGWHPDLNDGVRMNIRPFAIADILPKRVKIKWDKDRGKEPTRDKKEFLWFWGWDGEKQDFMEWATSRTVIVGMITTTLMSSRRGRGKCDQISAKLSYF